MQTTSAPQQIQDTRRSRVDPGAISAARAAGQEAADQCEGKALRANALFSEQAAAFILRQLEARGPTTGEDLTDACKAAGIEPHDDRAFGAVFARLSKAKEIEPDPTYTVVPRRKGHGTSGGRMWRRCRPWHQLSMSAPPRP